jgi:hypothetical protein
MTAAGRQMPAVSRKMASANWKMTSAGRQMASCGRLLTISNWFIASANRFMTAESRQIRQKTLLLPIFTPKMANIDKKTVVAGSSSKCYDYQTAKQAGHVSSDQERARCQQLRLAIVAGFCGWIHGLHQPCSQNPDLGTFPVTDSTGIAQDKKASKAATQQLSDEFDAADETLSEILDGLIGQFAATNAKFVSDYNNARIIVDTSASHASPTPPATPHP